MAALPPTTLLNILRSAMPSYRYVESTQAPRPAVFDGGPLGHLHAYLWTVTPDRSSSGRPAGEHKMQIILPDTARGDRQYFELSSDRVAFLAGWSPAFGVFVTWEISKHDGAAYSKNLQVPEALLERASQAGWAVGEPRVLRGGRPEVRCAAHPVHMERLLQAIHHAERRNLEGKARQVFLESYAPGLESTTEGETDPVHLDEILERRRVIQQSRLERSSNFSRKVLPLYEHACAICDLQLNVTEAAHILPVHDPRSTDEIWNGISLCRNHHRLFDNRIILIDENAVIRTDPPTLEVLKASGLGTGLEELVTKFTDLPLSRTPRQFTEDSEFRRQMRHALRLNYSR